MDLIRMARDMGNAIQKSEEYQRYAAAKAANDGDAELQNLIGEFNMLRVKLSTAMQNENEDPDKLSDLDQKLRDTYTKVMGNANMMEFNIAKQEIDALMNRVNGILMLSVNGEDPETCEPTASCGGDCGSCGGCH